MHKSSPNSLQTDINCPNPELVWSIMDIVYITLMWRQHELKNIVSILLIMLTSLFYSLKWRNCEILDLKLIKGISALFYSFCFVDLLHMYIYNLFLHLIMLQYNIFISFKFLNVYFFYCITISYIYAKKWFRILEYKDKFLACQMI